VDANEVELIERSGTARLDDAATLADVRAAVAGFRDVRLGTELATALLGPGPSVVHRLRQPTS